MLIGTTPFKKSLLATMLFGGVFAAAGAQAQDTTAATAENKEEVEVITVTSRKRTESLVQIPMAVSSVSAVEISNRNLLNKEDLFRTLAGAANPRGELILRGLSGGNSSAPGTSSSFTDDIPFDFGELYDVDAVEVLRGPQGTLWGSNAIGGTVRVLTRKPQLNEFEISTALQNKTVKNVDGQDLRGWTAVNIPLLDDTLALRFTGHSSDKPGAIKNAQTGVQRNRKDNYTRTQLLWQLTEDTSFNLAYWNVTSKRIGTLSSDMSVPGYYWTADLTPNAESPIGYDIDYNRVNCANPTDNRPQCRSGSKIGGVDKKYTIWEQLDGWLENSTDLLTLKGEFDNIGNFANGSYTGSYRVFKENSLDNWSRLDMEDMVKTWILNDDETSRVTHEFRLQDNNQGNLKWTVGYFYDKDWRGVSPDTQWQYHETDARSIAIFTDWSGMAYDPGWAEQGINTIAQLGQQLYGDNSKNYNLSYNGSWALEQALFGETSYLIETGSVGNFELTAGIRFYELEDYSSYNQSGVWIGSTANSTTSGGKESGNRKKFSLAWLPEQNQSVYLLAAEGYRPGGNNAPLANACQNDEFAGARKDRYTSDSIMNYELGYKANLDNKLQFTVAAYQINWDDVIVSVYMPSCGFSYTGNAAKARSRGLEWESKYQLTEQTNLVFNTSYTNSKLLVDVASLQAKAGQEMTMVPKYNAFLGIDHTLQLFNRDASVRLDVEAYGKYNSHFNARADGSDSVPSYHRLNLSTRFDVNPNTKISVFVKNLLDEEVINYKRARSRGTNTRNDLAVDFAEERSLTIRLDYTFF
ncbi:TonB-dependent receptor [Rheinheimera sp.]|uniref:TonB-dependent receptor n=1 Tax=Rheinheimera sp. TaxID=1869214 RepID=UPI0027BB0702|nr:TonB-dependent receptor [Rheinheimera sp.]